MSNEKGADLAILRYRKLRGLLGSVQRSLLMAIPLLGAWTVIDPPAYLGIAVMREQYLAVFLTLTLAAAFMAFPARRRGPWDYAPWYDWGWALAGLVVGLYVGLTQAQRLLVHVVQVNFQQKVNQVGGLLAGLVRGVLITSVILVICQQIPSPYMMESIHEHSWSGYNISRAAPAIYDAIRAVPGWLLGFTQGAR